VKNAGLLLAIAMALACLMSCDTAFNPSAPFQPRMVVYCVLATNIDTQYVRVYSTYNPPDNDPAKNPGEISVTDAQVSITEDGGPTFSFHTVTLPRTPGSRYADDVTAYAAYPFRAAEGKTYTLTVTSPMFGMVTAKTTIPNRGTVAPVNGMAMANPCFSGQDFGVSAILSPEAKGFLVRIYADYLSPTIYGGFEPHRLEVPMRINVISGYRGIYEEVYPQPMLRSNSFLVPVYSGNTVTYQSQERVPYNSRAFCQKVDQLYPSMPPKDLIPGNNGSSSGDEGLPVQPAQECVQFQQAVFYLVQFDTPLWNYYKLANAFQDAYSVRTDQPDYTNLKNGIGVFGSMAVDSLVWPYLPRIIPYHIPWYAAGCQ
jgi:hypothetical protein